MRIAFSFSVMTRVCSSIQVISSCAGALMRVPLNWHSGGFFVTKIFCSRNSSRMLVEWLGVIRTDTVSACQLKVTQGNDPDSDGTPRLAGGPVTRPGRRDETSETLMPQNENKSGSKFQHCKQTNVKNSIPNKRKNHIQAPVSRPQRRTERCWLGLRSAKDATDGLRGLSLPTPLVLHSEGRGRPSEFPKFRGKLKNWKIC